jgi:hypothetical protein
MDKTKAPYKTLASIVYVELPCGSLYSILFAKRFSIFTAAAFPTSDTRYAPIFAKRVIFFLYT